MHIDHIEYDFATIYFNAYYNDEFLEKILESSIYKDQVNYKKIYTYTMMKIVENIKGTIYVNEEKNKKLKKDLLKIKSKIDE